MGLVKTDEMPRRFVPECDSGACRSPQLHLEIAESTQQNLKLCKGEVFWLSDKSPDKLFFLAQL